MQLKGKTIMETCTQILLKGKEKVQPGFLTNAFLHLVYKPLSVVSHVSQSLLSYLGGFWKLVDGCGPKEVAGYHLERRGRRGGRRGSLI